MRNDADANRRVATGAIVETSRATLDGTTVGAEAFVVLIAELSLDACTQALLEGGNRPCGYRVNGSLFHSVELWAELAGLLDCCSLPASIYARHH